MAFELARELRRRQLSEPLALFVSAYPAPHLPRIRPLISHLPKAKFLEALVKHFDISKELADNRDLFDYVYPALLGDLQAVESYRYKEEIPLDCPIFTLAGKEDIEATADQISEWQQHSSVPLRSAEFADGHFFIHLDQDSVLRFIRKNIAEIIGHATQ